MGCNDPVFEERLSEEQPFVKCEAIHTLKKRTRSRVSIVKILDLYPNMELDVNKMNHTSITSHK